MFSIKKIVLSTALCVCVIAVSSANTGKENRKKNEPKEVQSKKSTKNISRKIVIGSHVMVKVPGGEMVEAKVVNKIGKKKYFIRAWGDATRVGTCKEGRMTLK